MKRILTFLAAAVLLAGCATKPVTGPNLVFIGIDGLGSAYLDTLKMPVIRGLMAEGSYTLHKRSVLPSASAINWASMFNGLPTEIHGYTRWNTQTPDIPAPFVQENGLPVTLFTLYRQAHPEARIGAIYEWDGVKYTLDTLAFNDRIWTAEEVMDPAITTERIVSYLKEVKPDVFYVHYDEPDHTGHKNGWATPEYAAKVEEMDAYVGQIIQALKDAGTYEHSIIVIASDHGGNGKSHGKATVQEMEAPFIIAGPGIRKGNEIKEFMMQYDVAPTIAKVLGLPIPDYWRGRPMPVSE